MNPERTQTLGGVIAAQMGSLQDLQTYVMAATTGMLSSSGFVWLVTDGFGRLGVLATYGAGTLLVNERRQTLSPDGTTELGGIYVPAENVAPGQTQTQTQNAHSRSHSHSTTSPTSRLAYPPTSTSSPTPPGARPLSTSTSVLNFSDGARPANVWSTDSSQHGFVGTDENSADGMQLPERPASLDRLGQTMFPLFCVNVHEYAWMAGGYGVWGREQYLERFWSCLDWAAVRDAYISYSLRDPRR